MKQYSFLIEKINVPVEDEEEDDSLLTRLGGAAAGMYATNYLTRAAARPILNKIEMSPWNNASNLDYLNDVKVNNMKLHDYLKSKNLTLNNTVTPYGPHFNPKTRNISLNMKDNDEARKWGKSVLAHELGHTESMGNSKIKPVVYGVSKSTTSVAALAQLINCFNKNPKSRKKIGAIISSIGGLSALPMVAEEINASMKGSKMLGLKGKEKARAFVGIGSYVALALSPLVIYHVSENSKKLLRCLLGEKNHNPDVNQRVENLKQQDAKVKIT